MTKEKLKNETKIKGLPPNVFATLCSRRYTDFVTYFTMWEVDKSHNYAPDKISIRRTEKHQIYLKLRLLYSPKGVVQISTNIQG